MRMNIRKQMENVHTQIGNVYLSCNENGCSCNRLMQLPCHCFELLLFFLSLRLLHRMCHRHIIWMHNNYICICLSFKPLHTRFREHTIDLYLRSAKNQHSNPNPNKVWSKSPFGLMTPTFHRIFVHIFRTYAIYYMCMCVCVFVWCASV